MNFGTILKALQTAMTYTAVEAGPLEKLAVLKGMAELPNCPDWVDGAIKKAMPDVERYRDYNRMIGVADKWDRIALMRERIGTRRNRRRRRHAVKPRHSIMKLVLCHTKVGTPYRTILSVGKPFPVSRTLNPRHP